MNRSFRRLAGIPMILLLATAARADITISETAAPGAFAIVSPDGATSDILYDKADATVVRITSDMLASDIEKVTGKKPGAIPYSPTRNAANPNTIFLGTLGHSPIVDAIVKAKNIDTSAIAGKWESFMITTVADPLPGIKSGLLIIGADRRGTAFGATTLSQKIGVSPWNWWADVPAQHHDALFVSTGSGAAPYVQPSPSVKYRGIFLNDEDWGLQPWAAKTYEPNLVRAVSPDELAKGEKPGGSHGDIGPKTYARIFELLLRLHANFCWPAMHGVTEAFDLYPENKIVADDYAIVMGSSHCEPMLRNNITEWGFRNARAYNYFTNPKGVLNYWKQRVIQNGKYENVYTLGMRGISDSNMPGGGTREQRVALLDQIITDQRTLLRDYVNPDVAKIPQIFCPYKEVLTLYQAGVKVPDDVTLVWADDNHGYIRQLSTPEEQKRSGGGGVYYHLSYWGSPHDYLWLATTPPALIWEELTKAADYHDNRLWIINVGDLKPCEIDLTCAMDIAYDSTRYGPGTINQFLPDFFTRTFGPEHASEMAGIMATYYRLNYQRKPAHMGFNTSQNPPSRINPTEFSTEEIHQRLAAFADLERKTNALYAAMPAAQRDAFYELIAYPVRGSALQNQKLLYADLARRDANDPAAASRDERLCKAAYDAIQTETAYYNDTLAGGKWKYMMSAHPHNTDVFKLPPIAQNVQAADPAQLLNQPESQAANAPSAPAGTEKPAYAEKDRYLSIPAEDPTANITRDGGTWTIIRGLGRLGDSIAVYPTTTPSVPDPADFAARSPELQYAFTTNTADDHAVITVQAIPTHRINPERGLRYAIAVDNQTPQIVDLESPENSKVWAANVLRAAAMGTTTHNIPAGQHTLHIYMVDPGVVLDHLTVDLGGLPKSYLPPPTTR